MKNRIIIFVLSLFAIHANAQTQKPDSSIRQLNLGLNLVGLVNSETWNATQIGSVKLRFGNHAFRFSGFSHSSFQPVNTADHLVAMQVTDSTIKNIYSSYSDNFSGISLGIDFFKREKKIQRLELYGGIGLFYGSSSTNRYVDTLAYKKDSTGFFAYNHSAYVSDIGLYSYQDLGVCPDVGILFNPEGLFSVSFETTMPIYLSRINLFHGGNKQAGGWGLETFYAANLILNLDLKKFMKKK